MAPTLVTSNLTWAASVAPLLSLYRLQRHRRTVCKAESSTQCTRSRPSEERELPKNQSRGIKEERCWARTAEICHMPHHRQLPCSRRMSPMKLSAPNNHPFKTPCAQANQAEKKWSGETSLFNSAVWHSDRTSNRPNRRPDSELRNSAS